MMEDALVGVACFLRGTNHTVPVGTRMYSEYMVLVVSTYCTHVPYCTVLVRVRGVIRERRRLAHIRVTYRRASEIGIE